MQIRLAGHGDRDRLIGWADICLNAGRELGEYLESDNCFVLIADGGFCAAMVNIDTADLLDIAVLPDKRKNGIASALMSALEDECKKRGVGEIFLEVRETNAPAISLYNKHGYTQISVRRRYYSDPVCDAVIMRKKI